ncbi:MAG: hypothetical protein KGO22_11060, partial [Gammaproteobacteria bacterium]|nr:hypothetical protein [Gammaproteobacteria bacterium]
PHHGLFREPGADAACEDAYFHAMLTVVATNYSTRPRRQGCPGGSRAAHALPRLKLAITVPGT